MRLAVYSFGGVFLAFLFAYAIWFRRMVLDIPISLRVALSVLPAYVLYRVTPYFGRTVPNRLAVILILAGCFAALVLYHTWRDVQRDDFKIR